MKKIYLDNAATTKMSKSVIKAMKPFLYDTFGNESSSHSFGRDASSGVEKARKQIADAINSNTSSIYFTSSGSESNSFAILGFASANQSKGNHIITSQIEHDSIINACKFLETKGFSITYLPVNNLGEIDEQDLEKTMTDKTILVSIMTANNEVGTIQNIEKLSKIAHKHGAIFHTDAVQAFGILPLDVKKLDVDALSASAHKIYGPKGTGFLYVKSGVKIDNIIFGGNQEFGKRGGTLNTANIVGFGKATEIAMKNLDKNYNILLENRNYFISKLKQEFKDDIVINGDQKNTVPAIISVSFKNKDANILLIGLDRQGIAVSRGSACTAGSSEPSYVLQAMGKTSDANSTIRFSLSKHTTKNELDKTIKELKKIVK